MSTTPTPPENDANLSDLGRALFETGGSKPSGSWEPPTPEELHVILPQYEIVTMLGRGGMGAVYMGRQTSLDRPVAIKILSAALGEADVGFTERFKNEAKAMAKLNHPGIVSVYDFGEAPGGLLYIVMEYVEGTDVARMIAANGRLHTEHAMAITAHVCDALAYAHERGIIHRDIKPANIMVGYDGAVKVADFGLAKVDSPLGNTLGLTQTGMAMGTMHFMAPEMLILGSAVDQRADIYAVGVMLYQMLTGKLPHGMFEMPSLQVPGLDPRYDGIISQAMREDRDKRYGSASALRKDLDAILTRPVVKADPQAANQAAAALPSSVRPKRPLANQPYRPPQPSAGVRQTPKKSASLAWLWITLLALVGLGALGWNQFSKQATGTAASIGEGDQRPKSTPQASVSEPIPLPAPDLSSSEWIRLFNGKNLDGWKMLGYSKAFTVDQGSIKTEGVRADLVYMGNGSSPATFEDFELRMKVKTGQKGNSGLWFHLPPDIQSRMDCDQSLQVQIDNSFDAQRTGSIVHIQPLASSPVADDTWFELRTLVQGQTVTVFVDGKQVNQWTQPEPWVPPEKAALARMGRGLIGLESWKGNVWMRDIEVRRLNVAPAFDSAAVAKMLAGRWVRTNMDRAGDAYLMDLTADGTAVWIGDNTSVRGTWQVKPNNVEVDWNSRFKFMMTLPTAEFADTLKGSATWPDGKSSDIVYERQIIASIDSNNLVETFNGHRYQFVPGSLTWKEAKAKAESLGGHLVTITSKEENEWLLRTYSNLLATLNRNIWLGAIEETPESGWKWVTGEPFSPIGWGPGEPNGVHGGGGQVGHPFMLNYYSLKEGVIAWNDSSTHFNQARANIGFIVEWEPDETTEEWTQLFNGKDLTGWRPLPASLPVSVSQGMIFIRGAADRKDTGALFYIGESDSLGGIPQLKNFEVMTHLKISKKGNSDLVIHASPITRTAGKAVGGVGSAGVHVQLWNDGDPHVVGGPADYLYRTGALFMISQQPVQHLNDDEWFAMRVRVEDKRLQVWLKKEGSTEWIQTADWTQPEGWAPPHNTPQARLGSGTLAFTNWVPADGEVWIKEVKFRSLDKTSASIASATTWIDTQGRSIQATFVSMEGEQVQLDIAGKITPVPFKTLSSASQKVAQDLQAALGANTDTGWAPLFPNDSVSGWTGETAPYRFANGILTATGKGTLTSPKPYQNFVMRFEVRLGAAANNGIGIWQKPSVGAASAAEAGGFEIQLQDDTAPQYSKQQSFARHGGIYGFKGVDRQVMGAVGTWNAHEIQVEDTQVTVKINGQEVLRADLRSLRSQFRGKPGLNLSERSGHLSLMSNIGTTEFRNMQIKELP